MKLFTLFEFINISKKVVTFKKNVVTLQPETVPRSVAGIAGCRRKVRAAQGAPLLKMEAVGDGRSRQKKTTAGP